MIKSLTHTTITDLIDCLLVSFEGYFVKMPSDLDYWKKRFHAARVDMDYSYGYFENEKLVAFIINGIDDFRGFKVAFNTGTGVIPAHRGKKIVDQLYAFAIPALKNIGVEKLALEVITKNDRAIRVYERLGFEKRHQVLCFSGELSNAAPRKFRLQEVPNSEIVEKYKAPDHYSWDHIFPAISIINPPYSSYVLMQKDKVLGYCFINTTSGYIAQLELFDPSVGMYEGFLQEIARVISKVKMNNVFSERTALVEGMKKAGLKNVIDQYEMWCGV